MICVGGKIPQRLLSEKVSRGEYSENWVLVYIGAPYGCQTAQTSSLL